VTLIIEKRLQLVALGMGLRIIADRHAGRATGQYLLQPAEDARRVVQILPDGSYCLAPFWQNGRRYIGTRLSFHEVEKFLARYEPIAWPTGTAPRARLVSAPVEKRSLIGRKRTR
jgi:hypothetical protein